jgi:hypothetical protein
MAPQAIFAATCHVTPLGTVPDRRNTVLGPGPKVGSSAPDPKSLAKPVSTDARQLQQGCGRAASMNIATVTGNGAAYREEQRGWSRASI